MRKIFDWIFKEDKRQSHCYCECGIYVPEYPKSFIVKGCGNDVWVNAPQPDFDQYIDSLLKANEHDTYLKAAEVARSKRSDVELIKQAADGSFKNSAGQLQMLNDTCDSIASHLTSLGISSDKKE